MGLIRHIRACNNAVLPGGRVPVVVEGAVVGWVWPALAAAAARLGARLDSRLDSRLDGRLWVPAARLPAIAQALAAQGSFRWRGEAFDVRAEPGGAVLAQIDRGALPPFGIRAEGVHLNALVGDRLWVARRAADKPLDPGKLDHLAAGGVAAGDTVLGTLAKEAAEEAGLPAELAARAVPVATIDYAMERAEGLRRDTLHCFDLELPPTFQPVPQDGEVAAFELWPLARVLETVRRTEDFKFNVNLVLIDLFRRRGMLTAEEIRALA